MRDLSELTSIRAPKVLPLYGNDIEFPGTVNAHVGTLLVQILEASRVAAGQLEDGATPDNPVDALLASGTMSPADAEEIEAALLGDAASVLTDLELTPSERSHVTTTLMLWHMIGTEAAEAFWEGKALAPQPAPNRETRRRTAGQSSKAVGSVPARSKVQRSTARPAGASSSPPVRKA
jgi:hypothetical protein